MTQGKRGCPRNDSREEGCPRNDSREEGGRFGENAGVKKRLAIVLNAAYFAG